MNRRRAVVASASLVVLVGAVSSYATWSSAGFGSATAASTTLHEPTGVTVDSSSKLVSWTASSIAGAAPAPESYLVERSPNTSPRVWSTSCTAGAGSTSCTDGASIPTAAGTYEYRYRATAVFKTWTAVSDESAVASYTVAAAAAPSVPGTPDLSADSDSGSSTTDNITKVTTPTFTGTIDGQAGQTVHIFVDGVDSGSGAGTGSTYSVTTSALSVGVHSIQAKATLDETSFSNNSGSLNITIDTQAPSVDNPTVGSNNNTSNMKALSGRAGNATNDVFEVTLSVTGDASCGLSATVATVDNSTGAWSGPTVSMNRSATCSVTVTQTDLAGNVGTGTANATRT